MQKISTDLETEVKDSSQTVLPRVVAQWADNRVLDNLRVTSSSDSWYNSTLEDKGTFLDVYWRLNDPTTSVQDYSGNGFNSTTAGGTFNQSDTPLVGDSTSKSILSSGSTQFREYIGTEACSFNKTNATLEAWFKSSSPASNQGIFTNFRTSDSSQIYVGTSQGTGVLTIHIAGTTYISALNICDGIWHHIAMTKTGSAFSVYVDGVFIVTRTVVTTGGYDKLWVGKRNTLGTIGNYTEFVSLSRARDKYEIAARSRQISSPIANTFFTGKEAFNARREQGFAWAVCDSVDEFNRPVSANGKFYAMEDAPTGRYEYGYRSYRQATVAVGDGSGTLPTYNEIIYASFNTRKANFVSIHLPTYNSAVKSLVELYWIDSIGARRKVGINPDSNLIPDSSFEGSTVGIWAISGTVNAFNNSAQTVQDGARALHVSPNVAVFTVFTPTSGVDMLRVDPSTQYDFSYYQKASANGTGMQTQAALAWYDINGVFISRSSSSFQVATTTAQRNNGNATSPSNAYYVSVEITSAANPNGNSLYFDAVQLKKGALSTWVETAANMSLTILANKMKFPLLVGAGATDVKGLYLSLNHAGFLNDTVNIEEIELSYEEDISSYIVSMEVGKERDNYDSSVPVGSTASNTFSMGLDNTGKNFNVYSNSVVGPYVRKDVKFDVSLGWKFGSFDEPSVAPAAWYKASGPLYSVVGGATPVTTDGSLVAQWTDVSGNNLHASTTTASARMLLKTGANGINGHPVVRSDGVNDLLRADVEAFLPTQTLIVVCKKLSAATTSLQAVAGFSDRAHILTWSSAFAGLGFKQVQDSAGGLTQVAMGGTVTNANIVMVRLAPGNSKMWLNGGAGTSFIPNTTAGSGSWYPATGFYLGGTINGSYGDYDIAEVLRYNVDMSISDINLVGNYLAQKYALTWTTAT